MTTPAPSCSSAPGMPVRQCTAAARHRQNGSIVVMTAIFISVMIILLASIDIGYLFFQKRDLQKIADLAAIAGAQQLPRSNALTNDQCATVFQVASANAQVAQGFTGTLTVTCGNWDPVAIPASPNYLAYPGGIAPSGQPQPTAVNVVLQRSVRNFFGPWGTQQIRATAIATASAPIAVFSVGSQLIQINNGVVPGLLTALGVNINGTGLVSYNGLANVSVTPSGLLNALGFQIPLTADVATIKQAVLLNTAGCSNGSCTLEALLGAMSTVLGQQNLLSALGLQAAGGQLVKIISDSTGRGGLFVLADAANGASALQLSINALQLLTTAIGVANSHNFAALPLTINVPGVVQTQLQVGIVEPPSIGIGGVGTTAYTSQVRVYSKVTANGLTAGLLSVNLPIAIDVVNGQGTITNMCTAKDSNGNDTATIAVSAPILKVCVGNVNSGAIFSTQGACDTALTPAPLVNILGNVLSLNTSFAITGLNNTGSVTLSKGQTQTVGNNSLQLGTTVSNLLQAVVATVLGQLLNQGQGNVTNNSLASTLLSATGNVLNTAVQTLDTSLTSLTAFVNSLGTSVNQLLTNSLGAGVISLLNSVGNLVGGLLTSVLNLLGNLLGNVGCLLSGNYNQCTLANQLSGSQSSGGNTVSNVLLTLLGLVQSLLTPVLNSLGSTLASLLNSLLGINIGLVDVTLIDLNCGGGSNVKLVY
ncbi:pilus assembly protein TadG-related protein [Herbaspirillum chlorophenolicum]|uniref:pilus assembly protein TadG-related protein n=1 Tax=Herbaspirillum chlorophenolicum TaxID=211589 RepID=UPI0009E65190|nr:pilus assembly protein TadG-related protein [Herbaspirillum chlorophenolicum]